MPDKLDDQIEYSIIIPVFNSGKIVSEIADRIQKVFLHINGDYELILVNDASFDHDTLKILDGLEILPQVQVIHLMRNFGQQSATLCGMKHARGKYLITMDDDLQHFPESIPVLLENKMHDVAIARFNKKKHTLRQKFYSRIKSAADRLLLGKPAGLQLSSFRLISREVSDAMQVITASHPYIPALIFYVTRDVVNVEVEHGERASGKSGYTFSKGFKILLNLLFNNSTFLLRVIAVTGISVSILSFLLILILVFRKVFFDVRVGWTSTIVSIFAMGGLILFAVGVVGEYLARIISGVEKRPSYVIRKKSRKQ